MPWPALMRSCHSLRGIVRAHRPLAAEGVRRAGPLPALVARAAGLRAAGAEQVGVGVVDDQVGEVVGVEHDRCIGER